MSTIEKFTQPNGPALMDAEARQWSKIAIFAYPSQGGPHQNIAIKFGIDKTKWCGHLTGRKNFEEGSITFIRSDRIYERDRQTNGYCMTARPQLCIAWRCKNHEFAVC